MQSFLDAAACRTEIKRMLKDGAAVRAAVAYWGVGATEELGIQAETDLTVVCDVRGGGSNTDEVAKLISLLGPRRVLTHDRLHAKTWVGLDKAILGSSNASSNGLGKEGREVASLLEANLLIDDQLAVIALNTWLDATVLREARIVTADDLEVGAERHRRRRDGRAPPEVGDLLSLLRTEPESFSDRNFFVWVWNPNPTASWADAEITSVQTERDDDSIDFYQDAESLPPGSYILDFNKIAGKAKLVGLYQVLKDRPIHQSRNGLGTLLLCREVETFENLRIGHRATWQAAARRAALSGREEWQVAEFATHFLI